MRPLPPGFEVELDASARVIAGGRLLVCAEPPLRALRLTATGRHALATLRLRRAPACEAELALARRLLERGLAHPRPPRPEGLPDVTVVVPVRDDPEGLRRLLGALEAGVRAVVVDDGSANADAVRMACQRHGATLIRNSAAAGPAAARNAALHAVRTELVAFLDSDCVPEPGWLHALCAHFADPAVGAVAPRVVPLREPSGASSWLEAYLAARSPLDMGAREGAVTPGGRIAYVPSAALLVRMSALEAPFDERLRYGEDVDLVWRLHDAGWELRYEPSVRVRHEEPRAWRYLLGRRFRYGTSAAPLSLRHGSRLAAITARPGPALAALLLAAGRRRAAPAVTVLELLRLARRARPAAVPASVLLQSQAMTVWATAVRVSRSSIALYGPALLLALICTRHRRAAAAMLTLAPAERWLRLRPPLDPLRWTLAYLADELCYGAGVWTGCASERTLTPLLPSVRLAGGWRDRLGGRDRTVRARRRRWRAGTGGAGSTSLESHPGGVAERLNAAVSKTVSGV